MDLTPCSKDASLQTALHHKPRILWQGKSTFRYEACNKLSFHKEPSMDNEIEPYTSDQVPAL